MEESSSPSGQQGPAIVGPFTRRDIVQIGVLVLALIALTVTWRLTPFGQRFDPQRIAEWAAPLRDDPFALLYVVGTHAVLGLVGFPITVLVLAAVLVFGAPVGMAYSWAGSLANATTGYLLGRLITRPTLIERADKTGAVRAVLARHGALSVLVLRLLPIGPFIVVNLLAGATRVRYRDYILGSAFGVLPAIVAVTLGAQRLLAALRNPGPISMALLALTVTCVMLFIGYLRHRLKRAHENQAGRTSQD